MNLALVGSHSLQFLQQLAEDNFRDIKNKNLIQKDLKNESVFIKDHSFSRIFKVIP